MSQPDSRWDRLKDLFAAAAAVPPGEREAFLRERGVGDATVQEVLDLLGSSAPPDEQPGDTVGPYKLLECIGEGGYGSVWMAEQRAPIQRLVALKLLKAGMDSTQVLARFEQERQALALMQHPNIAQVYDAGTTKRGRPFFVMELVKGVPITNYATRERLGLRQRLEVFEQVCRAVQHAHQKGVIHRDIKPSNVLVVTADGRPLAKVIDFGIAKATAGRLTERTLFTEHRAMFGTLAYMSPEQAEGLLDVDTRADVYSLGALLYELLTGGTPFDAGKLVAAGFGEVLRVLREVEPEKPSVRVSSKAGAGWVAGGALGERDPKRLFGSLRGDLDWVVMKALEKDRARRYGTADGLAADLERYLAGEAVEAVPPSLGYRVRKFVRRNRGPVVSVTAAVSIAAIALTFVMERNATMRGIQRESEIVQWSGRISSYGNRLATALTMAGDRAHDPAVAELARCPEDLRGWEWRHASVQVEESPRRLTSPAPEAWEIAHDGLHVLSLETRPPRLEVYDSRDGRRVAVHSLSDGGFSMTALKDAVLVLGSREKERWRTCVHLPTGNSHMVIPCHHWYAAGQNYATFDGKRFRIHECATGEVIQDFSVDVNEHSEMAVTPSGRWMVHKKADSALLGADGAPTDKAVLIDLDDPQKRIDVPGTLWINDSGNIHLGRGNWLFDEQTGEVELMPWPEPAVEIWDYPSDQHVLARIGNEWRVAELRSGKPVSPILPIVRGDGAVFHRTPRPGHRIFTGFLRLDPMSLETGEWLGPEPGIPDEYAKCTVDGFRWIVNRTTGLEVTTARPPQVATFNEHMPIIALATAPHRAALGIRGTSRNQDVTFVPDTGVPHLSKRHPPALQATTSGNGSVSLRLVEGERLVMVDSSGAVKDLPSTAAIGLRAMSLDHTGANMAVIAGDRLLHQPLTPNGAPRELCRVPVGPPTPPIAITGSTIALGQQDGFVQVLADRDNPRTTTWRPAAVAVTHLAWSPDGTTLFVSTADGSCALLLARDLSQVARLEGHFDAICGAAWSPDGKRVFTCSRDGTVRCWPTDLPSRGYVLAPLLTLTEPEIAGRPTTLLITPDGERLACGYDDGSIRVWDSVPWSERIKHVQPLFPSSPK
ncbi:MAG: protein kinase [Planctomycetes bacterium]|nr:protein kinase [Planctomycetota bacterium]